MKKLHFPFSSMAWTSLNRRPHSKSQQTHVHNALLITCLFHFLKIGNSISWLLLPLFLHLFQAIFLLEETPFCVFVLVFMSLCKYDLWNFVGFWFFLFFVLSWDCEFHFCLLLKVELFFFTRDSLNRVQNQKHNKPTFRFFVNQMLVWVSAYFLLPSSGNFCVCLEHPFACIVVSV